MEIKDNKAKGKSWKKTKFPFIFVFLIGFCIMIYPFVSQWYYRVDSGKRIENFEKEAGKLSKEEIEERIKLAKAYNSTLDPSKLSDPYSKEEKIGESQSTRGCCKLEN
ncbi:sortase family protein [Parvimonas sp. oral taxon 110 str. F0139]|nr:sortase family protein [Parvimonas sp. oral taxon 110 str. F0139]